MLEIPPSDEAQELIREARDSQLSDRATIGATVYPLVYAMIAFSTDFYQRFPDLTLYLLLLLSGLSAIRITLCLGFSRLYPLSKRLWRAGFVATMTSFDFTWGLVSTYALALEPWSVTSTLFLFSGSGLAGGMIATVSIYKLAYRLYLIGILVPPGVAAYLCDHQHGGILACFHLLYFSFLWIQGKKTAVSFQASGANTLKILEQRDLLKKAKKRAENASLAKSRLLANVSHELRTPMNAIVGMTEWALQDASTEKNMEAWTEVQQASVQLLSVINQVLDFAKIDTGEFSAPKSEPYSVTECTRATTEFFRKAAAQKNIALQLQINTDPDLILSGDADRLNQILRNLIGNALKFTDRGSIKILIQWKNETLHARIQDSGQGIPQEYLSQLFEPFTQADNTSTRRYGGTGLGLAISRDLAHSMGGQLTLQSNGPHGCTFHLQVPAPRATAASSESPQEKAKLSHPYRVLVVDDDATNRRVTERLLAQLGLPTTVAESATAALNQCRENRFDVILMDLQMPELDGFQATQQIRADHEGLNRDTPILAFTAHTGTEESSKCFEAGMLAFINKPLQKRALVRELLKLESQGLLDTDLSAQNKEMDDYSH